MSNYEIKWDDIPYEIRELVELGYVTREEAFEKIKRHNEEYGKTDTDWDWLDYL